MNTHTQIHSHTHKYIHTHMNTHTQIHSHTHEHSHTNILLQITHKQAHTYAHTWMCTDFLYLTPPTHTHTHTHTHWLKSQLKRNLCPLAHLTHTQALGRNNMIKAKEIQMTTMERKMTRWQSQGRKTHQWQRARCALKKKRSVCRTAPTALAGNHLAICISHGHGECGGAQCSCACLYPGGVPQPARLLLGCSSWKDRDRFS